MPTIKPRAVACGPLIWDRTISLDVTLGQYRQDIGAGKMEHDMLEPPLEGPGSSPANTITGLARLGYPAAYIGPRSNDAIGRQVVAGFPENVSHRGITTKKGSTGQIACTLFNDSEGNRIFDIFEGANGEWNLDDANKAYEKLFPGPDWFHMGPFRGKAQRHVQTELVKRVRKESPDIVTSLAPGGLYTEPGFDEVKELLRECNILILNLEEAAALSGTDLRNTATVTDIGTELAARLAGSALQAIFVTLGSGKELFVPDYKRSPWSVSQTEKLGSFIVSSQYRGKVIGVPANPKKARKPMKGSGAGDAYAAGIIHNMLKLCELGPVSLDRMDFDEWRETGIIGDLVASCCLEEADTRSGLPDLPRLNRLVAEDPRLKAIPKERFLY